MSGLQHFRLNEFRCPCCGRVEMDEKFLEILDHARGLAGVPFVITSGFRCEAHNAAVGGGPESAHLKGLAADIACDSSSMRFQIITACYAMGFNRFGVYPGHIHVDRDPGKPRDRLWIGSYKS